MIKDMSQTAYFKHEEPASRDKHNQDVWDQQNLEATHSRLFPPDTHEEKHSSLPTDEWATKEKLQCLARSESCPVQQLG
jgi:hypothetical protein